MDRIEIITKIDPVLIEKNPYCIDDKIDIVSLLPDYWNFMKIHGYDILTISSHKCLFLYDKIFF